jgi:methylenetetrahydrofolate reductase (NADPH)
LLRVVTPPDSFLTSAPTRTVITLELSPPRGTDVSKLLAKAKTLVGLVDAINVPDCQRAILKMSSMITAKLIEDATGLPTVWQLTCRDRNLIALQSDLMGAWALGLRTVLALTGDPVQVGDQKDVAKQVFHLDSTRLLDLIGHLNRGEDATARPLKSGGTEFTVGAALNPFRLHNAAQQKRLCTKLERGVRFFQTQPVYNAVSVAQMMDAVHACSQQVGLIEPPLVLVGLIPPKSAESARFLNRTVPGIQIPDFLIDLLDRSADPPAESIRFCADLVHQLKDMPHVGFHLMPVAMESRAAAMAMACREALGDAVSVGRN